jgi:hypothetical protein
MGNRNGVEVEFIDMEHELSMQGTTQTVANRILKFVSKKIILAQFSAPKKFSKDILPVAIEIGATMEL